MLTGNRSSVIPVLYLVSTIGNLLFIPAISVAADRRPNVIFFYVDQLRAFNVGAYGYPVAHTPNMDSLASAGVRFEYAFPGLPSCTPARACVLTGRMPFSVRSTTTGYDWMVVNTITMDTNEITIAEELNPLGYSCGQISSKWHVEKTCGLCCISDRQGYTFFEGLNSYGEYTVPKYYDNNCVLQQPSSGWHEDVMTQRAINFIHANQARPFHLNVWLCAPHAVGSYYWWGTWHDPEVVFTPDRMNLWTMFENASIPLRPNVPSNLRDFAEHQLRVYNAMTAGIDDCLGQIMAALRNLGIADNTIIIVSSDHGGQMGSHAVQTEVYDGWEKNQAHEESIRIPLIIYDPRFESVTGGVVRSELIPLMDLLPTIMELVGGPPPRRAQGKSFAPLITGSGSYTPRDAVMIQYNTTRFEHVGYKRSRVLRTDRWKLVACEVGEGTGAVSVKGLFDLNADPYEMNNLFADPNYHTLRQDLWYRLLHEMLLLEDPLLNDMAPSPTGYPHVDLGTVDDVQGLCLATVSDGDTTPINIGGRDVRKNDPATGDHYMYFAIHDNFAFQGSHPDAYIIIEYFDKGTGSLILQYDSSDIALSPNNNYKNGGSVALTGTNTWKQHVYHVTDAYFKNRQAGGADFRIAGTGITFYMDAARVFCPPTKAIGPYPSHQAQKVDRTANPSWIKTPDFASSYNVFFGTTNPPPLLRGQTEAYFDPGTLIPNTTYFWKIDSVNNYYAPTVGEVWSFTTGSALGDFDGDNDVDMQDFGHLQACLTGNGIPQNNPLCQDARMDGDSDVDANDVMKFLKCMNGPNMPLDPDCEN